MDQDSTTPGVQSVNYPNPNKIVTGDRNADGTYNFYTNQTMIDESAWVLATDCGSCHIGGGFVEKDRNGKRLSQMNPAVDGYTPFTMTVFDRYNSSTGLPDGFTAEPAPWSYPLYMDGAPVITPAGWGQEMTMSLPDGSPMPIFAGQVMMPNVKEMDCLMCHFTVYNNMITSAMAYSGAHNVTPSFGVGFMNMFTEAYDFNTGLLEKDSNGIVSLSSVGLENLKGNPPTQNCRNCHMPAGLKDFADMFRDFLSSAPMDYTGSFKKSFTGVALVPFDLNAPFGNTWDWKSATGYAVSPSLFFTSTGIGTTLAGTNPMLPAGFPAAMGVTPSNYAAFQNFSTANPGMKQYFIGGGNPVPSGPMYYKAGDQNAYKKGVVAFPRAEWFKRGDTWEADKDVHFGLECSGCHMDTKTSKVDTATFDGKSKCDPGRGYDSAGGVESNVAKRATVNNQNTVKMCVNCHVADPDGVYRNATGDLLTDEDRRWATDPTNKHRALGLYSSSTSPKVQAVRMKNATEEETFKGSHLDVLDCTVCHLYRKQIVVRALDSTSGNRYPNILGAKEELGMMGMFSDPFSGNNPDPSHPFPVNDNLEEWVPLYTWQKLGSDFKTTDATNAAANPDWRRKVYAVNIITAVMWNNIDPLVDANGDGVPGSPPSIHPGGILTPEAEPTTNYDPWIQRDMKAGINFGASGFAPIPIGFGSGAYQSAYDMNGKFTGAWQYVGLYGGNAIFSTPEELTAYKEYRNSIKDLPGMDGKSWSGTQYAFLGGPYKTTHGIRKTSAFVKGTKCSDCHAEGKGFFDGGFPMTGTAIKATTVGGDFMKSPAEILQIVGKAEDIETGAELARKDGKSFELHFDEEGCWDSTTKTFTPYTDGSNGCAHADADYKKVVDLDRSKALYSEEKTYNDVNGNAIGNRAAWVSYLKNIGAPAFANISSINGVAATSTAKIEVVAGKSVQLVANLTGNGPSTSYSWTINDATDEHGYGTTRTLTGSSLSTTFDKAGVFRITLRATNPAGDEPTVDIQDIFVKRATPSETGAALTITAPEMNPTDPAKTDLGLSWDGTPPTFDQVRIVWGDGVLEIKDVTALSGTQSHAYKRLARALGKNGAASTQYGYLTKFYFYKGNALVASKEKQVVLETTSDLVLGARLTRAIVAKDADSVTYKMKKGSETYLVFTLNNKGPGTNTISEVAIPALPSGLTLSSSLKTMGTFDPSTLKWTGITLAKGRTAYLTLKVKLAKTAGDIEYEIPETGIITSTLKDSKTTTVKDVKITAVN